MKIIILGPPGSGKGTISNYFVEKLNYIHLSTGDLFRKEMQTSSVEAEELKKYILNGKLVPDEVTNKILEKKLTELISQEKKDIILDGYPRNIDQVNFLETIVNFDLVINLRVSPDLIVKRITGRRSCPTCNRIYNIYFDSLKENEHCNFDNSLLTKRDDDTKEIIINRLEVYKNHEQEIINFYKNKNILVNIDSDNDKQKLFNKLNKIITDLVCK